MFEQYDNRKGQYHFGPYRKINYSKFKGGGEKTVLELEKNIILVSDSLWSSIIQHLGL